MNAAPQFFGLGLVEILIAGSCLVIPLIVVFAIVSTKSRRKDGP